MECSGVSSLDIVNEGNITVDSDLFFYMGVPSWGLRKRTPSSVTLASFSKLTIWNLPSINHVRERTISIREELLVL